VAICQEDRRGVMVYMRAESMLLVMRRDIFMKEHPQAGIVVSMSLDDFILLADGRK
jgi:hypothetical protein